MPEPKAVKKAEGSTEKATGGKNPWTEAEKYSLLLQAIQQIGGEKVTIKTKDIKIPGRTTKAIQHLWFKIRSELDTSSIEGAVAVLATRDKLPKIAEPKGTTKKRNRGKDIESDEATGVTRGRKKSKGSAVFKDGQDIDNTPVTSKQEPNEEYDSQATADADN